MADQAQPTPIPSAPASISPTTIAATAATPAAPGAGGAAAMTAQSSATTLVMPIPPSGTVLSLDEFKAQYKAALRDAAAQRDAGLRPGLTGVTLTPAGSGTTAPKPAQPRLTPDEYRALLRAIERPAVEDPPRPAAGAARVADEQMAAFFAFRADNAERFPLPGVPRGADDAVARGAALKRELLILAKLICGIVWILGWELAKIGLVCLLVCGGDVSSPTFKYMAFAFIAFKIIGFLMSIVSVRVARPSQGAADRAADGGRVNPLEGLSPWRVRAKRASKVVSTFFLSIFPSWRVIQFEHELAQEGLALH